MRSNSEKVEYLVNIGIVVAAVTCLGAWGWYAWQARATQRVTPLRYSAGDSVAAVNELGPSGTQPTLLLYVSPVCRYCTESMPFYKNLLSDEVVSGWRIVVAGREHTDDLREYVQAHGLPVHRIEFVRFRAGSQFKHAPTPSVFLIDQQRTITAAWVGTLTSANQMEILGAVKNGVRSAATAAVR